MSNQTTHIEDAEVPSSMFVIEAFTVSHGIVGHSLKADAGGVEVDEDDPQSICVFIDVEGVELVNAEGESFETPGKLGLVISHEGALALIDPLVHHALTAKQHEAHDGH